MKEKIIEGGTPKSTKIFESDWIPVKGNLFRLPPLPKGIYPPTQCSIYTKTDENGQGYNKVICYEE